MKIYENENNWVIEDQIDNQLTNKIKNTIDKNIDKLLKNKEGYSTIGKNAEQYWVTNYKENFYYQNKDFEHIKNDYTSNILNRLKKSNVLKTSDINAIHRSCWSVISEKNSFHAAHFHTKKNLFAISTVLYLNVPDTNTVDCLENNLYLILNSNPNNSYNNKCSPRILDINPEVGKLLIFPSWIIHGTYPQTKGIRQTFNIDYDLIFENRFKYD